MDTTEQPELQIQQYSMAGEPGDGTLVPGRYRPAPKHARRAYQFCEALTAGLIYFMVLFGPWAFGTTEPWSIWTMNGAGYLLGLILAIKGFLRWRTGYRPGRWDQTETSSGNHRQRLRHWWRPMRVAAILTGVILTYCLVSALNARGTYDPTQHQYYYHDSFWSWLPHSYDSGSSWFYFWQYLGLAGAFWALRDWLLGKTNQEPQAPRTALNRFPFLEPDPDSALAASVFPARLRRLLWLLCLNGVLLGLQGTAQRLSQSDHLLWLVRPRLAQDAEQQFGPYAYRGNAAQYLNLIWPVCFGFWWTLNQAVGRSRSNGPERIPAKPKVRTVHAVATSHRRGLARFSLRFNAVQLLLPVAGIMALCPILFANWGGAIIATGGLLVVMGLWLVFEARFHLLIKLGIAWSVIASLAVVAYLGHETLSAHWRNIILEDPSARADIHENAERMAADFPVFGAGPGTFCTLYPWYWENRENRWVAQAHNDWLETRITFGWTGFSLIMLLLLTVLLQGSTGQGAGSPRFFIVMTWLALIGCLLHATFDFPLQIYSVLFLFLVLCGVLSCLKWPNLNRH